MNEFSLYRSHFIASVTNQKSYQSPISCVNNHKPHLLLLDHDMPHATGLDVLHYAAQQNASEEDNTGRIVLIHSGEPGKLITDLKRRPDVIEAVSGAMRRGRLRCVLLLQKGTYGNQLAVFIEKLLDSHGQTADSAMDICSLIRHHLIGGHEPNFWYQSPEQIIRQLNAEYQRYLYAPTPETI